MNNQFAGSSYTLANHDIAIRLCRTFSMHMWYIPMLTEPRPKNKEDVNRSNYRLGTLNEALATQMKDIYLKPDTALKDITDCFVQQGIELSAIAPENKEDIKHYCVGNIQYFNHHYRSQYFSGLQLLVDDMLRQFIFLDPDAGVMPSAQAVSRSKGASVVLMAEVKTLFDKVTNGSVIAIRQVMNNYLYTQEARIKDMAAELKAHVILIVDEAIQSGLFLVTKSEGMNKAMINTLDQYLSGYKHIKNSSRILIGYNEGSETIIRSARTIEPEIAS